jgi:hypothetical protein
MLFIHCELDRSYPSQLSVSRLNELTADPSRDVSVITYAGADHAIMTRRVPWPRFADRFIEQQGRKALASSCNEWTKEFR